MANTPMLVSGGPPLEILWAEQQRQRLAQSNAANIAGASAEEMREWLDADVQPPRRELLAEAIEGWRQQSLSFGEASNLNVDSVVVVEITKFITLTGTAWSETQRQEFIAQCLEEFEALPISLLTDAIAAARKAVFAPARFVSWVFEFVDKPRARLEMEGAVLQRLNAVAQADAHEG